MSKKILKKGASLTEGPHHGHSKSRRKAVAKHGRVKKGGVNSFIKVGHKHGSKKRG